MEIDFTQEYIEIGNDIKFDRIEFNNYNDGPEDGIALLSNNAAIAFEMIGESRSRLHRCFKILSFYDKSDISLIEIIDRFFNRPFSKTSIYDFTEIELQENEGLKDAGHFIGVGPASLDRLAMKKVSTAELSDILLIDNTVRIFEICHAIIKSGNISRPVP